MKKYFYIKVIVVVLFLIVAYLVCQNARYYIPPVQYEKDEIRVVLDDTEVTKKIPDAAIIKDGNVLLSFDTIKEYFDKYLYYDQKYETVILTTEIDVIKLKLNDPHMNLNGKETSISQGVMESGDTIYVPIQEIEDYLNIKVDYNEKVIISTAQKSTASIRTASKGSVKLYKKQLAYTTGKYRKGDILTLFLDNLSGDEAYVKVRTPNGSLGYVKSMVISEGTELARNEQVEEEYYIAGERINLTWEYAKNKTPNRTNESKIKGLNVLSPTWIYLSDGEGNIKTSIDESYVSWARRVGYELWPTIKNDREEDHQELPVTSSMVTDLPAREKFIQNILDVYLKYHFDGINVDFEKMYPKDIKEYTQFIRELSANFRRNGIKVSVDVTFPGGVDSIWSGCYDRKSLADAVDYLVLMGYDQYGKGDVGPVASLAWVENHLNRLINAKEEENRIEKEKLILAVPFYSKKITQKEVVSGDETVLKTVNAQHVSMNVAKKEILNNAQYAGNITWDETMGQYVLEYKKGKNVELAWIEEEKALAKKAELVNKYDLAGIASWRRGFETDRCFAIMDEIIND